MKTRFLGLILFLFIPLVSYSQSQELSVEFRSKEKQAMYVLLGWSGLSMLGSGILAANGKKDQAIMHASWATINAGIATVALFSAKPDLLSLADYFSAEKQFNQILAINTGLDVAYVTAGIMMNAYGKSTRIKDFGTAVAIQGSFLLVFDAVLFWQSNERLNRGIELISSVQSLSSVHQTFDSIQFGLRFSL